jgi:beta-N-acetylhexosaminidase
MRERARRVIAAGSDLALHCNGDLSEMQAAAGGVPSLAGRAQERFDKAFSITKSAQPFDSAAATAQLERVLKSGADGAESV